MPGTFLKFMQTLAGVFVDSVLFLRLNIRSRSILAAENLFLRRQLALYVERKKKPRLATDSIRFTLARLSRLFDWRNALTVVRPNTLIRWHRKGFRLFWKWKSQPGRPSCSCGGAEVNRRNGCEQYDLGANPDRRVHSRDFSQASSGEHQSGRARFCQPRGQAAQPAESAPPAPARDRKSTRLNSSHLGISYAVFCLKKKKQKNKKRGESRRQKRRRRGKPSGKRKWGRARYRSRDANSSDHSIQ